jgi:hypothetical protein
MFELMQHTDENNQRNRQTEATTLFISFWDFIVVSQDLQWQKFGYFYGIKHPIFIEVIEAMIALNWLPQRKYFSELSLMNEHEAKCD